MANPTVSPADAAYARMRKFVAATGLLMRRADPELSETDTRCKLIDPIFRDVLGWAEPEIRREAPAADGWADYVLGAEYPYCHVEAKRVAPRFNIDAPSRARFLQLTGPHLLANRDVKPALEQVAKYAPDLGSQFAVLTNGEQFVVFQTWAHGRSWKSGHAMVWHDYDDILQNFQEFYNLLASERVHAGSLVEAFSKADSIDLQYASALSSLHNPESELIRNRFWLQVSRVLGPLLTDKPEDGELQEEIIRNCYVRTPQSTEVDSEIDRLLRDDPPNFLRKAGAVDLKPGQHGKTAFDHDIEHDIKRQWAGTYILTGGVGSGKTTFLRRFAFVVQPAYVKQHCLWFHIDFIPFGAAGAEATTDDIEAYVCRKLRDIAVVTYPQFCLTTGDDLRKLFASEIADAERTLLYGIPKTSDRWNEVVNSLVDREYRNDVNYVRALLRSVARRGMRVVVVLDNTDQLGEKLQESVFLLAQKLADSFSALCIVALREEKFFAAFRRGVFDAFGDRRFHIGSPSLARVLRARLNYGSAKLHQEILHGNIPVEDADTIEKMIRVMVDATTMRNGNIVRMLSCVSNGDMRLALGMFREFVSSGNTHISKIMQIVRDYGEYHVPFHEFAKSAILGSRRFYRSDASHVLNLFSRSSARGASHLCACRVLERLNATRGSASPHGEGFLDTRRLLMEYRDAFGSAEDLVERGEELLRRGLIESEPPRAARLEETDALRITASGAYYWQYLVRSFAYLDLVFVDTPLSDQTVVHRLIYLADSTDLMVRFQRVRLFLDYLSRAEDCELHFVSKTEGPYSHGVVRTIRTQVEREISFIKRKNGLAEPLGEEDDE